MNKLEATIRMKCPKCGEGDVFQTKNPYKKMDAMNENCPKCNYKFEKEHGFFYGAMYVSYGLNIALFVVFTVGYFLFFKDKIDWRIYIGIYVLLTILLVPVYYRFSRSAWLQMFG